VQNRELANIRSNVFATRGVCAINLHRSLKAHQARCCQWSLHGSGGRLCQCSSEALAFWVVTCKFQCVQFVDFCASCPRFCLPRQRQPGRRCVGVPTVCRETAAKMELEPDSDGHWEDAVCLTVDDDEDYDANAGMGAAGGSAGGSGEGANRNKKPKRAPKKRAQACGGAAAPKPPKPPKRAKASSKTKVSMDWTDSEDDDGAAGASSGEAAAGGMPWSAWVQSPPATMDSQSNLPVEVPAYWAAKKGGAEAANLRPTMGEPCCRAATRSHPRARPA